MKTLLSLLGSVGLVTSTGITTVVSCDKTPAITIDELPETDVHNKNFTGDKSEFTHANEVLDLGNISYTHVNGEDERNIEIGELLDCLRGAIIDSNLVDKPTDKDITGKHPVDKTASSQEIYDVEGVGCLTTSRNEAINDSLAKVSKYIYKSTDGNFYSVILNFSLTEDKTIK